MQEHESTQPSAPLPTPPHHHQQQHGATDARDDDEAESVDLEGWALVDDEAEIVGSEPRSTTTHDVPPAPSATPSGDDASAPASERHEEPPAAAPLAESEVASTVQHTSEHATPSASVDATESDAAAPEATERVEVPDGSLRIRLRVGEHVRPAWCRATQIVDDFIAEFFADAVAQGKRVRLIYMGMLLIHDRAMGEYGIEEDGVIHCVVTDAPRTAHPQAAQGEALKGMANPANLLLVGTGVGLYGLWTLLYHFPHLFTWKSIFLLSLFSAAHISASVARFAS